VPTHCLSTSFTHGSSVSLLSINEATWIVDPISDNMACKAGQRSEEEEGGDKEEGEEEEDESFVCTPTAAAAAAAAPASSSSSSSSFVE